MTTFELRASIYAHWRPRLRCAIRPSPNSGASRATPVSTPAREWSPYEAFTRAAADVFRRLSNPSPPSLGPRGPRHPRLVPRTRRRPGRGVEKRDMPLNDGYGVVIGTLHHYFRDPENDFGQYYHANAIGQTPSGTYKCAIDVDSKGALNGVEWRVVELGKSNMHGVVALPEGWHYLRSNAESGALDYVRSPEDPEPLLEDPKGLCALGGGWRITSRPTTPPRQPTGRARGQWWIAARQKQFRVGRHPYRRRSARSGT